LVTFQTGTPAKAAEVNSNFTALKGAVNSKQDKIAGACNDGQFIRKINADGTVVCAMTQNDAVLVLAEQFVNDADTNPGCVLQHGAITGTYYSAGTGCSAYAAVVLADKIKLNAMYCSGVDASALAGAQMSARLTTWDGATEVFSTNPTVGASGNPEPFIDDTAGSSGGDDVDYATIGPVYLVQVNFGTANSATVGKNLALWSCSISYTSR
jgi:hypothetical protein